ncbi:hypothetical protein GQR58_028581 [Nymphon striatum]|nr:hypothetical protein GQR58_028581 [Nymphon striatum]
MFITKRLIIHTRVTRPYIYRIRKDTFYIGVRLQTQEQDMQDLILGKLIRHNQITSLHQVGANINLFCLQYSSLHFKQLRQTQKLSKELSSRFHFPVKFSRINRILLHYFSRFDDINLWVYFVTPIPDEIRCPFREDWSPRMKAFAQQWKSLVAADSDSDRFTEANMPCGAQYPTCSDVKILRPSERFCVKESHTLCTLKNPFVDTCIT